MGIAEDPCSWRTPPTQPPRLSRGLGVFVGRTQVTGDQMVAAMDAVGVDGAILVSPFSMYRYDASYALEVYAAHPDRFGVIRQGSRMKSL